MKNIFPTLLIFFLFQSKVQAQTWGDSTLKNGRIFYAVEVDPKFPGGMSEYYKFIAEHLKMPTKHLQHIKKMVSVQIIIDKTGRVAFAEIVKGENKDYNMAVLEMIKAMPLWSPALQNNYPVPVFMTLPILFVD